jgi:hypothetical protein
MDAGPDAGRDDVVVVAAIADVAVITATANVRQSFSTAKSYYPERVNRSTGQSVDWSIG